MPYADYGYLDPIHIVWRAGTEEDPYIDRIEYLKILNHKVVLAEIPDRFTKVKIAGMIEINYDGTPKKSIAVNEFSVNYSTGVIQFNKSQESNSANIIYKGKGFIQYPSNRIYHQDEMNNVVESLDKIIVRAKASVADSETKTRDYEYMRDLLNQRVIESEIATTDARDVTGQALSATEKALDAYETTRLVFKPFLNNYTEIAVNHPNPEIGWTVQVYDTGIRYRYDGIEWVPVDLFGGAIPLANELINGLMSKENFVKLKKINEITTSRRVLVFVPPSNVIVGKQGVIARFPFDGTVIGVKAICGVKGESITQIAIEKTRDMVDWTNILSSNIVFDSNAYFDNGTAIVSNVDVIAGDLFRLDVVQKGTNIQNITVEVIIETL